MISVVLMLVLIGWLVADHRKAMKELRAIQHAARTNENRSQHGIIEVSHNQWV